MKYIDEKILYLNELYNYVHHTLARSKIYSKEKEIREFIGNAGYLEDVPEIKNRLDENNSLYEILNVLDDYIEKLQEASEKREESVCEFLNKCLPKINDYAEFFCYPILRYDNNTKEAFVEIPTRDNEDFKIILENSCFEEKLSPDEYIWCELYPFEQGYRYAFFTRGFKKIIIDFTSARIEKNFYNALSLGSIDVDNPWEIIFYGAETILEKNKWDTSLLNKKEKELLPIFEFFGKLNNYCDAINKEDTILFEKEVKLFKLKKVKKLLNKLTSATKENVIDNCKNELKKQLNYSECEPLWRKIYNDIYESQKDIPTKVSVTVDKEKLEERRKEITTTMRINGYSGEYPTFYKEWWKKGAALIVSYGMDYLVVSEKHTFSVVYVTETSFEPYVNFISGTAFIRDKEYVENIKPDIFYCMFNEKGRRNFNRIFCYNDGNIHNYTEIAIKKAELKRLTKEEKFQIGVLYPLGNTALVALIISIVMGVFFSLGINLFFFILALITGLVSGDVSVVFEVPWWILLIFAAVGFGVPMGIIELIKLRRG